MLRIAAIIVVRNGAPTIARVLSHLGQNRIDVFAIDHGSVDDTPAILHRYSPSPVVEVLRVPFDGVHRWRENLGRKSDLARRAPHDWIIHTDADEIMESPRVGESLRGMIERLGRDGYDLVECDEFVFVPTRETEDHAGGDFVASMRRYYHFAPPGRRMQRAIRRAASAQIDWAQSGGHRVNVAGLRTPAEKMRLRHYIGLSLDHLRQQYLGRVFGADELRRGWHGNRVATTPGFITAPTVERLIDLDEQGWRTDQPEARHLIFNQSRPFRVPGEPSTEARHPPMPFVVGGDRSGTTLLRGLLDAHPDLVIAPATRWLGRAIDALAADPSDAASLRVAWAAHDGCGEAGLDPEVLGRILARHDPATPFDTIRSVYRLHAERRGAARVGDARRGHGLTMTSIALALPESRFIHLIRDGREVAAAQRGGWAGLPEGPRSAAISWLWTIREVRQQAQFLPHYLEVRFEDLVRQPEMVLRRIGDFIELPFHPAQIESGRLERFARCATAARGAAGRLAALTRRLRARGSAPEPLPEARIGRWRQRLSSAQVEAFERVAGIMLVDLGYPLARDRRGESRSAGPERAGGGAIPPRSAPPPA